MLLSPCTYMVTGTFLVSTLAAIAVQGAWAPAVVQWHRRLVTACSTQLVCGWAQRHQGRVRVHWHHSACVRVGASAPGHLR